MEGDVLIYVLVAVVAFLLILVGLIVARRKKQKFSILLNISFLLIILSLFFGERIIAYPLIGIAVIIALIDMFVKIKKK